MLKELKSLPSKIFLPACIISWRPYILVSFEKDFLNQKTAFIRSIGTRRTYILLHLGWQCEDMDAAAKLVEELQPITSLHTNLRIVILCNSEMEDQNFKQLKFPSTICNHNIMLDENRYKVMSKAEKRFDAIYLARFTPFKRHYLAKGITKIKLIGGFLPKETEYARETQAMFKNVTIMERVSSRKVSAQMNECRVGLCLSAEEGAMYVSAEYLLSGLPIVNTYNKGGRDSLFDQRYCFYVDAEEVSVKNTVAAVCQMHLDPEKIRQATIDRIHKHRQLFIDYIQGIYNAEGSLSDYRKIWRKVFFHKLGLRCGLNLTRLRQIPRRRF